MVDNAKSLFQTRISQLILSPWLIVAILGLHCGTEVTQSSAGEGKLGTHSGSLQWLCGLYECSAGVLVCTEVQNLYMVV